MKDYIKPTFTLAGLFPVALAATACTYKYKGDELQALYDAMRYTEGQYDKTFAYSEVDCAAAPVPAEYCKFTSSDVDGVVALTS